MSSTWRSARWLPISSLCIEQNAKYDKNGLPVFVTSLWWCFQLQTLQNSCRQCNEHTAIDRASCVQCISTIHQPNRIKSNSCNLSTVHFHYVSSLKRTKSNHTWYCSGVLALCAETFLQFSSGNIKYVWNSFTLKKRAFRWFVVHRAIFVSAIFLLRSLAYVIVWVQWSRLLDCILIFLVLEHFLSNTSTTKLFHLALIWHMELST